MAHKNLRVETGFSENKGKGTFNAHISLIWPDRPSDDYYYQGDPPFKTKEDALAWTKSEVFKLVQKIGVEQRVARLVRG